MGKVQTLYVVTIVLLAAVTGAGFGSAAAANQTAGNTDGAQAANAFGQLVSNFVHNLQSSGNADGGLGHYVATFVLANNPAADMIPDHAGPPVDRVIGPPDHAGAGNSVSGPPDHAGAGNSRGGPPGEDQRGPPGDAGTQGGPDNAGPPGHAGPPGEDAETQTDTDDGSSGGSSNNGGGPPEDRGGPPSDAGPQS